MKGLRFLWISWLVLSCLQRVSAQPAARAEGQLRRGWIELEGPVAQPHLFDIGSRSVLRVDLPLLAGESRRFELVLPRNGGLDPIRLGGEVTEVRFGGFEELDPALPPGLRARAARPPLAGGESGLSAPRPLLAWTGLVAFLVLGGVLIQRGLPWLALLLAGVGALVLALLGSAERLDPPRLHIEDGEVGEALRIVVDSGFERLSLPAGAPGGFRIDVSPVSVPTLWTLSENSAGEPRLRIEAPKGRIDLRSARAEEGGHPVAANNAGPSFEEVWTRNSRGAWTYRGSWATGETLPEPASGEVTGRGTARRALPTWLVTGLPQGRTVLVARESSSAPEAGGGTRGRRWLRLTGFESP